MREVQKLLVVSENNKKKLIQILRNIVNWIVQYAEKIKNDTKDLKIMQKESKTRGQELFFFSMSIIVDKKRTLNF